MLYVRTVHLTKGQAYCDMLGVCIPFRHVFLTPVYFVRVLLTPTCHVRVSVTRNWWRTPGFADQLFILQLMQPRCYTSLATQNHCYNETRTSLTARSRSLLTAPSLFGWFLVLHCWSDSASLICLLSSSDLTPVWNALRPEVGSWRTD
jgi:hypothetical protein